MNEDIIKFYEASGIFFNRVGKLFHYRERFKVRYTNITTVDKAQDCEYIKKMMRFYMNKFGKALQAEENMIKFYNIAIDTENFKITTADFKKNYYFIFLNAVYKGARYTKYFNYWRSEHE